jgi:hypothetical protein
MFIERHINSTTKLVELWQCDWEHPAAGAARKSFVRKVCDEQPISHDAEGALAAETAICWSYGRTLGNIAVTSPELIGHFPANAGSDATLPCDFVSAGKFRHGAHRLWCRTHQCHWGIKADLESYDRLGEMRCASHAQPMNYVISPLTVNIDEHAEVGVWCSMPAALATFEIPRRPPKIHVHVRKVASEKKIIDRDFPAISLMYGTHLGMFKNEGITRVNITPPSAFDFVCGVEDGREMSCINCPTCGYPHLDLGEFSRKPHRRHFCGNCGRDSTWSTKPIVSTPLKLLHDQFAKNTKYEEPNRRLNLDDFSGCNYMIWASTPAIVWSAERAQEYGIHVHVHDGKSRIIDDTFSEVVLNGTALERSDLITNMIDRTIV